MSRFIVTLFISLLFLGCTHATEKLHEVDYQRVLCEELDGEMEYVLADKTRVDCLTDTYAIEVDFAKKWAESIGQSLYYADMTGKKPAVALIMNVKKDKRYLKRLQTIAGKFEIKIFIIKKQDKE